jgi:hypothetical protein
MSEDLNWVQRVLRYRTQELSTQQKIAHADEHLLALARDAPSAEMRAYVRAVQRYRMRLIASPDSQD